MTVADKEKSNRVWTDKCHEDVQTETAQPVVVDGESASNGVGQAKAKTNRVFSCLSDQLIAMVTTIPEGGFIPPIPTLASGDTEAFLKAYRKPLDISPDDPQKIQDLKRHINDIRDQIAAMIAQNPEMTLSEILNAHRDRFNNNSEMFAEAQSNYDKLVEEGEADLAESYRQKANEVLRQTGAAEIKREGEDDEDGE